MAKLIEYNGQRYLSRELAEMAGIPAVVFKQRLERGWTLTEAMTLPANQRKSYKPRKPRRKQEA